jgi:lipoprotein NlpI
MQEYTDAITEANIAIELNPDYGYAYLNRGIAKEMIRDKKGACSDWSKAEELGVQSASAHLSNTCN